ncbi:MAG: acyl-CoA dehydrogenase [Proteobacteria bacterium]|nr:acyl-CoA dehydrogenase [Pseudomonadota bacterium]
MTGYSAPVRDMRFVLDELADLAGLARLPGYEEATPDLVEAVLEEAGKLASEVLAPLNQSGDREGVTLENGVVRTPTGFPEAYARFVEGGWGSLAFDPDYGGQGLPWTLAIAVQEMWNSANLSFALAPVLTQGTVELLQTHGTEAQKATYLPKLISGAWTGTMDLTEPQAGSDLGALKTRAVANGDHYLITGQKIFITWGEHDCAENIVHMVLARTPDAPAGTKGLSVFIVPKFLPAADGALGARNDLRCVSLEDKLGIHASPTCVMAYGDSGGAVGYLMGEENRGMACMFTMMNNARVLIGLEGLAIGERAYQAALAYARERVQSHAIGSRGGGPVPIIRHPDVRRMLMTMKATNEAMRGLIYTAAAALDTAKRHPDAGVRAAAQARIDLLTPVVKAWLSDSGCEVASLGVQVHGGMGYIEETGAAQYYRDVRIACIYEGTNGIQALDLLTRKLLRDEGAAVGALLAEMAATLGELKADGNADGISEALAAGVESLAKTTDWLLETGAADLERAAAGATPYLRLFGTVVGGWLLARGALAAERRLSDGGEAEDRPFLEAKVATARFYADNILPRAAAEAAAVTRGADSTLALDEARF